MAAPRTENQAAQRQAGAVAAGLPAVAGATCGELQTREGLRRARCVSARPRGCDGRRFGACREPRLSVPGPGLRLRPERLGDAHERTRSESDALCELLRRADRARREQDAAARATSRRLHPLEGTELPRARRVQLDG